MRSIIFGREPKIREPKMTQRNWKNRVSFVRNPKNSEPERAVSAPNRILTRSWSFFHELPRIRIRRSPIVFKNPRLRKYVLKKSPFKLSFKKSSSIRKPGGFELSFKFTPTRPSTSKLSMILFSAKTIFSSVTSAVFNWGKSTWIFGRTRLEAAFFGRPSSLKTIKRSKAESL